MSLSLMCLCNRALQIDIYLLTYLLTYFVYVTGICRRVGSRCRCSTDAANATLCEPWRKGLSRILLRNTVDCLLQGSVRSYFSLCSRQSQQVYMIMPPYGLEYQTSSVEFLPRCMECRRVLAMRILSVCKA